MQRGWAATVAAGPSDLPLPRTPPDAPEEREALLSWSAESTTQLLDALREVGPDRGCWTWWGDSQSPQTSGAVARHQVQEAAVHTYDAQACVGSPSPLPEEVALDGVDEFLATSCATTSPWPHEPAVVEYQAIEGPAWRLALGAAGSRPTRVGPEPAAGAPADASLRGTAGELVLALYGRVPIGALRAEGDGRVFDLLLAWDPEE